MRKLKIIGYIVFCSIVAFCFTLLSCDNQDDLPKLATPEELRIEDSTLEWNRNDYVGAYVVDIDGVERRTSESIYSLSELPEGAHSIKVKATGSGYTDSDWSVCVTYNAPPPPIFSTVDGYGFTEIIIVSVNKTYKDITELIIPDRIDNRKVIEIRKNAFYHLSKLESISIGKNVTTIEYGVMRHCPLLKTITIDPLNPYFFVTDNILYYKDSEEYRSLHTYPIAKQESQFTVPDSIKYIETNAFKDAVNLTSINLNNVEAIWADAFAGCVNIENITGGSNINHIVMESGLCDTKWFMEATDEFFMIGKCLIKYNGKEKDVVIPQSVACIGPQAFMNSSIESVYLSQDVKVIGDRAFANCVNLHTIRYFNHYKSFSGTAFKGSDNVTSVVLDSFAAPQEIDMGTYSYLSQWDGITLYVPYVSQQDYRESFIAVYAEKISSLEIQVTFINNGNFVEERTVYYGAYTENMPIADLGGYEWDGWWYDKEGNHYGDNTIWLFRSDTAILHVGSVD